jgi:hypothetical protein
MKPLARRPLTRRRALAVLLASACAALSTACASGGAGGDGSPRGTRTRIIRAEVAPLQQLSAYEAIERLRPNWLRAQLGRVPTVVLAGNPGEDLSVLRTIRAMDVEEMRLLSPADATTRYGTGYDGGAIIVELQGG